MLGKQRETDVNRKRSRSRKDPWEAENEKQGKESKGEGLEEPAGDGRKIGGERQGRRRRPVVASGWPAVASGESVPEASSLGGCHRGTCCLP